MNEKKKNNINKCEKNEEINRMGHFFRRKYLIALNMD